MSTKSLHTLNARGHVMLEVMRDYFNLSPERMLREIQGLRRTAEDALARKEISYDRLKSALVPDRKRREVAFVFDSKAIESSSYGYDVFERMIPLFDKKSNHSVLDGDYLDRPGQASQLFDAFDEAVELRRDVVFHHPTQFFVVYINNLTDAMVRRFDEGLRGYPPYVGLADMTFSSRFKIYLSTMLVNSFIKHGTVILQGHEPDRSPDEDVNMSGYPFEENGYVCRSVSGDLMGALLSYKIERPVFPGFETDTEFALNAVSATPMALDDFRIDVEEAKLDYLKSQKVGSMARAGLMTVDTARLAAIIRKKVSDSYIYNMMFDAEHNVTKFNIIIELRDVENGKPTRLLAALEYRPVDKVLRLITFY
jgi:hypothetical protein